MSELKKLQIEVRSWIVKAFGEKAAVDPVERNHRFLEESLELVQACGCTKSEAHQLVDYVFGRPTGQRTQELGGVMITLAGLSSCQGMSMSRAAADELKRCHKKIELIRKKQANKPKNSPLPEAL